MTDPAIVTKPWKFTRPSDRGSIEIEEPLYGQNLRDTGESIHCPKARRSRPMPLPCVTDAMAA